MRRPISSAGIAAFSRATRPGPISPTIANPSEERPGRS